MSCSFCGDDGCRGVFVEMLVSCVVFNGDGGNIYVQTATRFSERLSGEGYAGVAGELD